MASYLSFDKRRYGSVGSTNDIARELAEQGCLAGTVVTAEEQLSGRGRTGANWSSPPGNLYQSLILRPDASPSVAAQLSFVTALALREAIATALPDRNVLCKWPNDVLCDNAKVAGILLESKINPSGLLDWIIIGMGVNIAHKPEQVPYPVTKLRELVGGESIDVARMHDLFLNAFSRLYSLWADFGFIGIRELWLQHAKGLGQPIRVRLPKEERHGTFCGIDEQGALILELPSGEREMISAGAVFFDEQGAS